MASIDRKKSKIRGVTGNTGVGKTTLCQQIVATGKKIGVAIIHIDVDTIREYILTTSTEEKDISLRQKICYSLHAPHLLLCNEKIDRKGLSCIIWENRISMDIYTAIVQQRMRELIVHHIKTYKQADYICIERAALIEHGLVDLVGGNIIYIAGQPFDNTYDVGRRQPYFRNSKRKHHAYKNSTIGLCGHYITYHHDTRTPEKVLSAIMHDDINEQE